MKNKTTGKIERLNLKKKELEIKELELRIDKLLLETSPRLFVPNIQDQSQKQPKGETIRNYNPEKRWDKYKKSKIEVREFDLVPKVQPEKQEEWKSEYKQPIKVRVYPKLEVTDKPYSEEVAKDVFIGGESWVENIKGCLGDYSDLDGLIEIISKLLSERTFTKDELEIIDDWAEWDYCTNKDVVRVKDKVSKLLKDNKVIWRR